MEAVASEYWNDEPVESGALENKSAVLAFMRSHKPVAVAPGFFTDAVTGETVDDRSLCAYEDGEWEWDDCDTYHVEKYDLKLKPEFVKYALTGASD